MKCPKCGQEFEGHPSECPSCHVKFTFKKKEEEKITFDESGNVIQPAKSDEEIKKEIIEKHQKDFVTTIKFRALNEIFAWPFFIALLGLFFPRIFGFSIQDLFVDASEDAAGLIVGGAGVSIIYIIFWGIAGIMSIIYFIRFIICLRNICSKTRQQIIMNKQYEKFKSLRKDRVSRFFMGKGKYIYFIVSVSIGFPACVIMFGLFTFIPMIAFLTLIDFIVLSICDILFDITTIVFSKKSVKSQNKIIITMYPEYKQYEW